jgi:hypothetical protein
MKSLNRDNDSMKAFMAEQPKRKKFNVAGLCVQNLHYMVDTSGKINKIIRDYVEPGEYFTINRARQYGKTTTFSLIEKRLQNACIVVRLSFEGKDFYFESFQAFCKNMRLDFIDILEPQSEDLAEVWEKEISPDTLERDFRRRISEMCNLSPAPVVLMIDEVDRATDFGVFITFLGLLRDMYLERNDKGRPAFQSVILAGVHDIKNLKRKIRPDSAHAYNSPWNIAANFDVDMSFSPPEIATMLEEYEGDHHTGMDAFAVAKQIYYYTNGYPFLVSRLCKTIDEAQLEWSPYGVDNAETRLLGEDNTLFDDLIKNVLNNEPLRVLLESILFRGDDVGYEKGNPAIDVGVMYGIFRNEGGKAVISNIIFETRVTNLLISLSETRVLGERYAQGGVFVKNGVLDMDAVASRFEQFMKSEYRDEDGKFIENHARLLFLSFLKPIINSTGHYAVEPRTRSNRRMDVVVFYGRDKFIVELKIWRGEAYEEKGYDQLVDYLDSQERKKGWLISFSGNKKSPRAGGMFAYKGFEIVETIIAYRGSEKGINKFG